MDTDNKKDLNNKIIILRKHLKSVFNLTKLNLAKKIKKTKDPKQIARRESEQECFKRIKFNDIPLSLAVHPIKLHKTLTNSSSSEVDRVTAKVLLHKHIQETISSLKENYGIETVETFLMSNDKNIKKNSSNKLSGPSGDSKKSKKSRKKSESDEKSDENDDIVDEEVDDSKDEGVDVDGEPSDEEPKLKTKQSQEATKKTVLKPPKVKLSKSAIAKKSIDSFFLSAAGENYHASVAAVSSSDTDEEIKVKTHKKQKLKKDKKNLKRVHASSPEVVQKLEIEPKVTKKLEVKAVAEAVDIHPSWKAKAQMRKSQIQTFTGTKIKFDE